MKRLTIFVHYDSENEVKEYILYHLRRLRDHSTRLVFMSNSPVSQCAVVGLSGICDAVRERPNLGYDFAAWRDAIGQECMEEWDEVLLVNSSIVGPLFSLEPVFTEMSAARCDFWGLSCSQETREHMQSFFVCFRSKLITSEIWYEFWRSVEDEISKDAVIDKYETRFKYLFEQHGFASHSYITPIKKKGLARIVLHRTNFGFPLCTMRDINYVNPTIYAPQELIERGFPYIKASLIWGEARRQGIDLERIRLLDKVDYDWNFLPKRPRRQMRLLCRR